MSWISQLLLRVPLQMGQQRIKNILYASVSESGVRISVHKKRRKAAALSHLEKCVELREAHTNACFTLYRIIML